jgi:transcriptional regulator with XRE-family HTH domain
VPKIARQRLYRAHKKNYVGLVVRRLREEKGISQRDFAGALQRAGLSLTQALVSKIESRDRTVTDLEVAMLANALDVSPAELFEGWTPPKVGS